MTSKERFYNMIMEEYPSSEICLLLSENPQCVFYELCQSYIDIALNAQKTRMPDGSLGGVFQYVDIDNAKEKTVEFVNRYSIQDTDNMFRIIESTYEDSISPNETRQKSGFVKDESGNFGTGFVGVLYFFTEIDPDLFNKIEREIKEMLAQ